MANSTAVFTDIKTLTIDAPGLPPSAGSGFTAASLAMNYAPAGFPNPLLAMVANTANHALALRQALQLLVVNTDSADALHTLCANILATMS